MSSKDSGGAERLTLQVADGAFWTLSTSALNKVVTFGGQVLLAWFLVPQDVGLVAMAMSISAAMSVFSLVGAGGLLVQKQREFGTLSGEVFWLSLAVNAVAGITVAALAPVAGAVFREPRIVPLVLLLAPTFPLQSLPTVYAAKLQTGLKFRSLTSIYLGAGVLRTASSVLLAWAGFGAYSIVLPLLWVPIFSAAAQRLAAGPVSLGRPRLPLGRALLIPLLWLSLQPFLEGLQLNGTNFVMGLLETPATVGLYFWGTQVSSQALYLLAANLGQVLFPGLARLEGDTARQREAFLRAMRVLLLMGIPVCVLQVLLARPVIQAFFPERWDGAIQVVQWLSAGAAAMPAGVAGVALLRARGRFGLICGLTAAQSAAIVCAAAIGCARGGAPSIAAWVAGTMLVCNVGMGAVASFMCGCAPWVYVRLLLAMAAAGAVEMAAAFAMRTAADGRIARCVLAAVAVCVVHLPLTRCFAPETYDLVGNMLRRLRRGRKQD